MDHDEGNTKHHKEVEGAFTRDGSRILSWGSDGSIRIWDAQTGKQLGPTMKHVYEGSEETSFITGAVFSRDESAILAWGRTATFGSGMRKAGHACLSKVPLLLG